MNQKSQRLTTTSCAYSGLQQVLHGDASHMGGPAGHPDDGHGHQDVHGPLRFLEHHRRLRHAVHDLAHDLGLKTGKHVSQMNRKRPQSEQRCNISVGYFFNVQS